jgi:hypothetical protein
VLTVSVKLAGLADVDLFRAGVHLVGTHETLKTQRWVLRFILVAIGVL